MAVSVQLSVVVAVQQEAVKPRVVLTVMRPIVVSVVLLVLRWVKVSLGVMPGLPLVVPLVVELGVFLDVLIAVAVLVILTNRMSLSFMTTDTTVMKKLKG